MNKSPSTTPAIAVSGLSKRYKDGHLAVKNVSFSILPGDFTVLLGLNGAGKTSLISMITGLNYISEGNIRIQGYDIEKESFTAKRFLGVVPQEVNFNPFTTVMDSIYYHAGYFGATPEEVLATTTPLLKKARLWNKRNNTTGSLSGGTRRILMLIRALAHKPSILILDEPTANLDIEIRETIWDILKTLNQEKLTILLTTHNLVEAQDLCENLLILHHGKLMRNQSIHEAITSLQERYYTFTFQEAFTDDQFAAMTFVRLGDRTMSLRLSHDDDLSSMLVHIHAQGLIVEDIMPSNNQLEQLLRQATDTTRT